LNLYVLSYMHIFNHYHKMDRAVLETVGIIIFWNWYIMLILQFSTVHDRVLFVLCSHIASSILHLQINMSHFSMSTDSLGCDEHFAVKALRTTTDIDCPIWMDWFHGGLQFQVIHHLFPTMPRHNLRSAIPYVKQFCTDNKLQYHTNSLFRANNMVIQNLSKVANHVKLLYFPITTSYLKEE